MRLTGNNGGSAPRAVADLPFHPPLGERAVGMEFYWTTTPGIPAATKGSPEEFRVTEISSYPLPDPDGPFTVLRVTSRNWEQHELGEAIARRLGLSPHAIQWSGTKDRRAVAERLLSYRGPPPEHDLGLREVDLLEAYRARDGLVLGHHYGNAFEVRVVPERAPPEEAATAYRATAAALRSAGGFPNFFGLQRFGEVRPVTHEVGRYLVRGDPGAAVDAYLIAIPPGTSEGRGDEARRAYAGHRDPARALREFPPDYRFERSLLERLARGQRPEQALRALSRDLRLLFVHAYQSLLFNRWLSRRRAAGLPFDRPVAGDRILRAGRDGTLRGQDAVPVESDNERECAELVARGRALLAGPLVGTDTPLPSGPGGTLLADLLAEESIAPDAFRIPFAPELSSRGTWRPVLLPMPPIGIVADPSGVVFRFALPKGAYATVLLREFLKNGAETGGPTPSGDEPTNTPVHRATDRPHD
jgi:tRNA pseudouridine13 synthase